jgi:hypothetical protein
MTEKSELDYKEIWNGEYKGVKFEIAHWRLGWNYYLYIPVEQLPIEVRTLFNLKGKYLDNDIKRTHKRLYYEYSSKPIISDLDWHCGITLYEKSRDEKGAIVGYKLGCDYMHFWDEGKNYSLPYVECEAKHSIDKLWEHIPNLLLRSAWNGEYYPKDKVYYTDKGVCVALEHKEQWEKPI